MPTKDGEIAVAVNGYGVIGKRVTDAIVRQDDIVLAGIADITTDWRIEPAVRKGYKLFAAGEDVRGPMRKAGFEVSGTLDDLLGPRP